MHKLHNELIKTNQAVAIENFLSVVDIFIHKFLFILFKIINLITNIHFIKNSVICEI